MVTQLETMKHTISVLVENRPGVLARAAGLFARRGFNIDSLAVSTTEDPDTSRMTIVVKGPVDILEQISKQLYKLIDVIKVMDHTEDDVVSRELALFKVHAADANKRAELMQIVDIFRAKMIADRVGIMKQGRLVAIRKKEDFKHADLEQIYIREMEAADVVS